MNIIQKYCEDFSVQMPKNYSDMIEDSRVDEKYINKAISLLIKNKKMGF